MPLPAVQERSVWGDDKMANAPELSLRGGRRPTWQSHATGYVFAGSTLLSDRVLRDSHVASLLGMTNLGALCGRRCHPITCKPARRSGSAASGLQKSPRPGGLGDPFLRLNSNGILARIELVIEAAAGQQLRVRALLDDMAVVEHKDEVGVDNGG